MQTLKTSAIVVLLVTVMYAAYVSLTTPPQQAGPEMEQLILAADESLDIDLGLPESLDMSTGNPDPMNGSTGDQFAYGDQFATDPGGSPGVSMELSDRGVSGSINDQTSTLSGAGGFEVAMRSRPQPSPAEATASATIDLPPASGSPADIQLDPQQNYASTGSTFTMPSADQAASDFAKDQDPRTATIWSTSAKPEASVDSDSAGGTGQLMDQLSNSDPSVDSVTAAPVASESAPTNNLGLANAIRMADAQYAEDQKRKALSTLSLFYDTPNLSQENREQLLSRLDPLAREVVYSREHLLEQPHRVRQNETLMQIAALYEVPWQLLANINGINDPITVLPGTDLKIVRGPFRADVSLQNEELTLFVGDLYAGRFPIAVGTDPSPKPGTFTVLDKQRARTFYDANGTPVPPGSSNNPYGSMWLDLGGQLCIHGSPEADKPTQQGCISLAERYAGDLYGILGQGSTVTIRR